MGQIRVANNGRPFFNYLYTIKPIAEKIVTKIIPFIKFVVNFIVRYSIAYEQYYHSQTICCY